MDNELSNILENKTPKQHGINISQISKDKLKNIIDDNEDSEDGSLFEVDVNIKKSSSKILLKSKEKEDKEEKSKDKDGKSKEEKKKLKEEAKEEEKKKKEEEKKKKEEEKKKKG
jgi:outer membrane biosynthesis protein TonB